jgi:hypothetical protein
MHAVVQCTRGQYSVLAAVAFLGNGKMRARGVGNKGC